MSGLKEIRIIGGGLAGLTLGIGLRQHKIPVRICEATSYPRHRVCGEFMSGRGQERLKMMGLDSLLARSGAIAASTAVFLFGHRSTPVRALPRPAACLSRYKMDAALAQHFRDLGGELLENKRAKSEIPEAGTVRATGRRPKTNESGWRWFGLKVHARNVQLAADLEMHTLRNGYVGLCRLGDGEVNICGLFRSRVGQPNEIPSWRESLLGRPGSTLRLRLDQAMLDEHSFCSVAGLSLAPARASQQEECCIGDALTMIPPITGNGMSMAFEAAQMAIEPLTAFSRGEVSWEEATREIRRACGQAFAHRLAWARWLQRLMFFPGFQGPGGGMVLHSHFLWRLLFSVTRS